MTFSLQQRHALESIPKGTAKQEGKQERTQIYDEHYRKELHQFTGLQGTHKLPQQFRAHTHTHEDEERSRRIILISNMPITEFLLPVLQDSTEPAVYKLFMEWASTNIICGDCAFIFTTGGGGGSSQRIVKET